MKVGVVIPAHNAQPFIETLLATVNAQTYPCAAYIVDDASTDGLAAFLKARPSWWRRFERSEQRRGWPAALNFAANLAILDGCDALFYCAADDFLRLDCIERCVRALARHDWVVPYAQQIGGENVVQASRAGATLADFALWPPVIDHALIHTHVWQAVRGYATDVTVPGSWGAAEDWDFWIRVLKAGYGDYGVIEEPLYYHRVHPGQLSRGRAAIHQQTVELLAAKHPDVFAPDPDEE